MVVAYIAHELRTPIALQLALAEATLADPDADGVAWRAMAEGIVASCDHQQRLIEALLDLSCAEAGLAGLEDVDIAVVMRRVLHECELSGLECVVTLERAVVVGDPTLLERLAANLVSNAIRHNIEGGRIAVTTRTDCGRAQLSIANTGPLIPAGEVPRLFEPFKRLGSRRRTCADGVGLGLAIVQSIADAHGAILTARAPAAGGLEIEVSFPA
jgi:signal transduction histidine kinase